MKLYISGPMSGLPDFNRPAFEAARAEIESLNPIIDVFVLSPTDNPPPPPGRHEAQEWRHYMAAALQQVVEADGIALLGGWSNSPGACAEHAVAVAAGIPCWPIESWMALAGRALLAPRPLSAQVDREWPRDNNRRVFDVVNIRRPDEMRFRPDRSHYKVHLDGRLS